MLGTKFNVDDKYFPGTLALFPIVQSLRHCEVLGYKNHPNNIQFTLYKKKKEGMEGKKEKEKD